MLPHCIEFTWGKMSVTISGIIKLSRVLLKVRVRLLDLSSSMLLDLGFLGTSIMLICLHRDGTCLSSESAVMHVAGRYALFSGKLVYCRHRDVPGRGPGATFLSCERRLATSHGCIICKLFPPSKARRERVFEEEVRGCTSGNCALICSARLRISSAFV